mgnify:CR=1 FL=1
MNENKLVSLDDAALDDVNGGLRIGFGEYTLLSAGGKIAGGYLNYDLEVLGQKLSLSVPVPTLEF